MTVGQHGGRHRTEEARGFGPATAPTPAHPVLVVHGARDRIFPYRDRPLAADWLAEHLTPASEETP